ncbi:11697_t:CDS:2 [Paraglomus brasilianum]|uniref:11697_t:CDS:1 n=1 Tax=Paraglomus brasilianum TaxID=144538 RepID=A0A9N8WCD2_9GLOM|nr:11697_t:CDS:2 [Paraglomus brasilianum]
MSAISGEKPKISVGDRLPEDLYFGALNEGEVEPRKVTVKEVFGGKNVVMFGIPGAFTSVCSSKHLPQYYDRYEKLKQKGVDIVACTAVNDPYVLREWARNHNTADKILMLADGDATFHSALSLIQRLPFAGIRNYRYSMYVSDCVVKIFNLEEPGALSYKVSGPDRMLQDLERLQKEGK